jgi:hypothetical protein
MAHLPLDTYQLTLVFISDNTIIIKKAEASCQKFPEIRPKPCSNRYLLRRAKEQNLQANPTRSSWKWKLNGFRTIRLYRKNQEGRMVLANTGKGMRKGCLRAREPNSRPSRQSPNHIELCLYSLNHQLMDISHPSLPEWQIIPQSQTG